MLVFAHLFGLGWSRQSRRKKALKRFGETICEQLYSCYGDIYSYRTFRYQAHLDRVVATFKTEVGCCVYRLEVDLGERKVCSFIKIWDGEFAPPWSIARGLVAHR